MMFAIPILAFVTLQRLGELWLAEHNTRWLKAHGGFEVGAGHYPLLVVLHTSWLGVLWGMAWDRPANLPLLGVFVALQALRVWVIVTLDGRWTTRIIVLPDAPLVRKGPYRLLSHPNYLVVVGEIAVLPLVFGLPVTALIFSALNAAVLFVRIRAEDRALGRAAVPA